MPKRKPKRGVTRAKGGGVNLFIGCGICGKPIMHSNKFGMFCEDMCGLAEAKKAEKELNALARKFASDDFLCP